MEANQLSELFEELYSNTKNIGVEDDANFFDVVHLSENDHTNILWQILQFKNGGKYPFLESFVKNVLGLGEIDCSTLSNGSGTQYQSIPLKTKEGKGFIDLLLKVNDKIIIIENKVCGAGDGELQLLRYYFSFVKFDDCYKEVLPSESDSDSFQKRCTKYHNDKSYCLDSNVYLVYLTKEGGEPSPASIGKLNEREEVNYIPISYIGEDNNKNVLSWLKEDVLPNLPYGESGRLLRSLLLYIDYFENYLDYSSNQGTNRFLQSKKLKTLIDGMQIKELIKEFRSFREEEKELSERNEMSEPDNRKRSVAYKKFLKAAIEYNLVKVINRASKSGEWMVDWKDDHIILYKKEWMFPYCPSFCYFHWELLKDMDKEQNYWWEIHLEKKPELKQHAETIKKEFFPNSECTKSGHITNVYLQKGDYGGEYLLSKDDSVIKSAFERMLNDREFKDITDKVVERLKELLDKRGESVG